MRRIGALLIPLLPTLWGAAVLAQEGNALPGGVSSTSGDDVEDPNQVTFSAALGVTHSLSSGAFLRSNCPNAFGEEGRFIDDIEGNRAAYNCGASEAPRFTQNFDSRLGVSFTVLGHRLTVQGRFLFDVEYLTQYQRVERPVIPYDLSFSLIDPALYVESFTGIQFGGTLRIYVPTSVESLEIIQRFFAVQATLTASRRFGPLGLSYGFGVRKNFNNSPYVQVRGLSRVRDLDSIAAPGDAVLIPRGRVNTEWDLQNSFSASLGVVDWLSVGYSLMLWTQIGYPTPQDAFTSVHAHGGVQNVVDVFWSSLGITVGLNAALADYVELPVGVSASVGVAALHRTQYEDQSPYPPLIFNAFTNSRAARNEGSAYLQLLATY